MSPRKFAGLITALALGPIVAVAQDVVVFERVNVVPMDEERVLENQTVVVRGERIDFVGDSASANVPDDARRIDGGGRYLVPGLAEMHAHVPPMSDAAYVEEVLFLYVANGVTTARGMLGETGHLELRDRLERHDVLGPRLYTSGPSLSAQSVDGPEHAARIVREQAEAGYDFVKLHPGLTRDEFDAAVDAARDAGIDLAGHVSEEVGVVRALEARQATIDHFDGYAQFLVPEGEQGGAPTGFFGIGIADRVDLDRIPAAVDATREAGVRQVPTQTLIERWAAPSPTVEALAAGPDMAYVSPATRQQWIQSKRQLTQSPGYDADGVRRLIEARRQLLKAMHDADPALLLLGSDAPQVFNVPGFSLHHELDAVVAAGLTPYEALRTGTVHPAEFFDAAGEFGRVAPGLAADLVLVDGNPLEDVAAMREIAGVMVRGRWLDREELDAGLAEIAERHR